MKVYAFRSSKLLLAVLLLVVLILSTVGLLAIRHAHHTTPTLSIHKPDPLTLNSATQDTQQIYNALLQNWSQEDRDFILNNKSWFTKNFVQSTSKATSSGHISHSLLFCSNLTQKPDKLYATAADLNGNNAVVYVMSFHQDKVIANQSVNLQFSNNKWDINAINCNQI